jgi:hypothetical protein
MKQMKTPRILTRRWRAVTTLTHFPLLEASSRQDRSIAMVEESTLTMVLIVGIPIDG